MHVADEFARVLVRSHKRDLRVRVLQQNAQQFWSAVLDAIRCSARSIDHGAQPAATAGLDAEQLAERALSELAEQSEPVVLIIDDLHELKSADALPQLERLLATLPGSARLVLSSRRACSRLHGHRSDTARRGRGQFPGRK